MRIPRRPLTLQIRQSSSASAIDYVRALAIQHQMKNPKISLLIVVLKTLAFEITEFHFFLRFVSQAVITIVATAAAADVVVVVFVVAVVDNVAVLLSM